MENTITLGQALAYLHFQKLTGDGLYDLDPEVNSYLDQLKLRANDIKQHKSIQEFILNYNHKSHTENTDLFLHLFLNRDFSQDNIELLKLFNDYYDYFEEYCKVLNDYIEKLQELKQNL